MFETLGFTNLTALQASVLFGALVGIAFGALAEISRFCFRRTLVGEDRRAAGGVWFMALAVALTGTQGAVQAGLISFEGHRFLSPDLPILAVLLGGGIFGAGMVLTRGCAARLTVLSGTGNLRALGVLALFAITAHATMKGLLAPAREAIASVTLPMGEAVSLAALPGGATLWSGLIALAALAIALRSGNRPGQLVLGAAIGLLVPLAWVGTGFMLLDAFDPIPMAGLAFTAPAAETLFYAIASTAIPAGFGTGLFVGVMLGALASALSFGRFEWQSFSSPRQTGRYGLGAVLMGVGGVLAGGCTVGAGLSGVPTLSVAALLALAAIAIGALAMNALLTRPQGAAFGVAAE